MQVLTIMSSESRAVNCMCSRVQWIQSVPDDSDGEVTEVGSPCMVMLSFFCALRFLKNPPLASLLWSTVREESYI